MSAGSARLLAKQTKPAARRLSARHQHIHALVARDGRQSWAPPRGRSKPQSPTSSSTRPGLPGLEPPLAAATRARRLAVVSAFYDLGRGARARAPHPRCGACGGRPSRTRTHTSASTATRRTRSSAPPRTGRRPVEHRSTPPHPKIRQRGHIHPATARSGLAVALRRFPAPRALRSEPPVDVRCEVNVNVQRSVHRPGNPRHGRHGHRRRRRIVRDVAAARGRPRGGEAEDLAGHVADLRHVLAGDGLDHPPVGELNPRQPLVARQAEWQRVRLDPRLPLREGRDSPRLSSQSVRPRMSRTRRGSVGLTPTRR